MQAATATHSGATAQAFGVEATHQLRGTGREDARLGVRKAKSPIAGTQSR